MEKSRGEGRYPTLSELMEDLQLAGSVPERKELLHFIQAERQVLALEALVRKTSTNNRTVSKAVAGLKAIAEEIDTNNKTGSRAVGYLDAIQKTLQYLYEEYKNRDALMMGGIFK